MGSLSIWHWLIVIIVAVLLFGGRGKITGIMGDFAKGIKAFKSGMKEQDEEEVATATAPPQVTPPAGTAPSAAAPVPGNAAASTAAPAPANAAASTNSPAPATAGASPAYGGVGNPPRDQRA